jgi:hypothetical protein
MTKEPTLAMNAYAWDLVTVGVERSIDAIRALECNRLLLSVAYHRTRTFHPRHPTVRFCSRPLDYFDYSPDRSLYPEGFPLPPVNAECAEADVINRARNACAAVGLRFMASVIGCHNSTVGHADPSLTIQNCYGDRYTFALCPANPRVKAYLGALIEDICRHAQPDAVLLDSFGFLQAVHREHHELMFVRIGAAAEHLLSLCFCPHCRATMPDADATAALCRRLLDVFVERETVWDAFDREETAALLVEFPELYAVAQTRRRVGNELLQMAHVITSRHGVHLDYISGLHARPSLRAWTEGNGLASMASGCRHIYVQSYFETTAQAEQDLRWALANVPAQQLVLANMVGATNVQNEADLAARDAMARNLGMAGVSYYNYGLLNRRRLEWIRASNRLFTTMVPCL